MENTIELASVTAAVGVFMPMVIAVVMRPTWSKRARLVVAMVTSLLAGLGTVYAAGQLNTELTPGNILVSLMAVVAAAQVTFDKFWKPLGVTSAVERATTPAAVLERAHTEGCPNSDDE